jgi:formamidopyrimidine-DNA glycosylase
MPELPDLEVFSKNLNKRFRGKTLERLEIVNQKKLKTSVKEFRKSLEGEQLKQVYREGKELRFEFTNKNKLGLHLMLHGDLKPFDAEADLKHTIFEFHFAGGGGLAVTDWQGMANISLNPEEKASPDALSEELNEAFLIARLSKTRTNIKNLLMDQKAIRGIGNAYADEILYAARIHPLSICKKIPPEAIKKLARSIKKVLREAVKEIERKEPDLISGEVRDFLPIHNHKSKQSPGGAPIRKTEVNKRVTYYTDEQELYR